MIWKTSRRALSLERPLVMGILNVTPDSFSDGGKYRSTNDALRRAEQIVNEGGDIIDVGGESTRPGSQQVSAEDEIRRTIPVIDAIAKRFDTPISIDTSKAEVATAAIDAGAEIINDISGLRFDERIATVAAETKSGLIMMHSIGDFATMHTADRPLEIVAAVIDGLQDSVDKALEFGIGDEQLVLDVGIGFGKAAEQNVELIVRHQEIVDSLSPFPFLIGTSRKSFIAKLFGDREASERLGGSIVTALAGVRNGARIVRVHDVAATVEALSAATGLGLIPEA
ncbi:MAG TPA: dihydropteroate synthase [Pyrinomonadaceae bacterium]|nr:dihydropteroate synthase [Pyrinomonadaceae bacterium]